VQFKQYPRVFIISTTKGNASDVKRLAFVSAYPPVCAWCVCVLVV